MKKSIRGFSRFHYSLILCCGLCWLMNGCFLAVDRKSVVQLTIQDSIGKAIPGLGVNVMGYKQAPILGQARTSEEVSGLTNQTGVVKLTLSWPKGTAYYDMLVSSNISPYEIIDCPLSGNSPAFGGCRIKYDRTISATIRVKKVP